MVPPEITGDLRDRIYAGLLRIDAARQSRSAPGPRLAECLETAYDVYARELSRAGWQLTITLLTESIPAWVFQWAWARRWLPRARQLWPATQQFMGMRNPEFELYDGSPYMRGFMRRSFLERQPGPVVQPVVQPIPEAELQAWVRARVGGRVIYWQAEALAPEAEQESTRDLLVPLQARYSLGTIAEACRVARSTLTVWRDDRRSVLPATDVKIVLGLRKLAKKTPSE